MALITKERTFGKKLKGKEYLPRPGVYAVILDDEDLLAVMCRDGRYYLPGGGLKEGEDPIQALHRGVAEETGWTIRVEYQLGSAREYVDVPDDPVGYEKRAVFFPSEIVGSPEKKKPAKHGPKWVTMNSFEMMAALASHYWAAGIAVYVSKRLFMSHFDDVIE